MMFLKIRSNKLIAFHYIVDVEWTGKDVYDDCITINYKMGDKIETDYIFFKSDPLKVATHEEAIEKIFRMSKGVE